MVETLSASARCRGSKRSDSAAIDTKHGAGSVARSTGDVDFVRGIATGEAIAGCILCFLQRAGAMTAGTSPMARPAANGTGHLHLFSWRRNCRSLGSTGDIVGARRGGGYLGILLGG